MNVEIELGYMEVSPSLHLLLANLFCTYSKCVEVLGVFMFTRQNYTNPLSSSPCLSQGNISKFVLHLDYVLLYTLVRRSVNGGS